MKIFLASAIEKQLDNEQNLVFEIRSLLNSKYGDGTTFLATFEYPTPADYLPYKESLEIVLSKLDEADYFVMYYPRKVFSGALMELAWAIHLYKPSLVLTENVDNLPYMVRGGAPNMQISIIDQKHDAVNCFNRIDSFVWGS